MGVLWKWETFLDNGCKHNSQLGEQKRAQMQQLGAGKWPSSANLKYRLDWNFWKVVCFQVKNPSTFLSEIFFCKSSILGKKSTQEKNPPKIFRKFLVAKKKLLDFHRFINIISINVWKLIEPHKRGNIFGCERIHSNPRMFVFLCVV